MQAYMPFVRLPDATLLNFVVEEAPFCFIFYRNEVATPLLASFSVVGPCPARFRIGNKVTVTFETYFMFYEQKIFKSDLKIILKFVEMSLYQRLPPYSGSCTPFRACVSTDLQGVFPRWRDSTFSFDESPGKNIVN